MGSTKTWIDCYCSGCLQYENRKTRPTQLASEIKLLDTARSMRFKHECLLSL